MEWFGFVCRRIVCTVISLFLPAALNTAVCQVCNVTASQKGKNVVVSYVMLEDASNVQLYVSTDGGTSFLGPLRCVSGDVGKVSAGSRRIVWDVLSEYDTFVGENVVFKVTANPSGASQNKKVPDFCRE